MRRYFVASIVGLLIAGAMAVSAPAAIRGDYVEVRSADVYTGPCFANSEVGLVGNQAILAWRVKEGAWKGTNLSGLGIVAVVRASATLGDPYHNPEPSKAVLIVDERATPRQRAALEDLAKVEAGRLLSDVVRVEAAPIHLEVGEGAHHGQVTLEAGQLARIETRSLCAADHLCGNEEVYYPPLVKLAHAMPAFTLEEAFRGPGLGVRWDRMDRRSAFIGTFAL